MLRARNVNPNKKGSSLSSILMFIVIVLAVIGGYAIYKGSISFTMKDGRPQIDAANYDDAKPIQEAKKLFKQLKDSFK